MKECKTSTKKLASNKLTKWQKYNLTTEQRNRLWYGRKVCNVCKKNKLLQTFAIPYKIDKFYDICKKCRDKRL